MASYGRNFDFRIPPVHGERAGRFVLTGSDDLPIGVPVKYDSGEGESDVFPGAQSVELATGAQAPTEGLCGILVYEHAPAAYAGSDPVLTRWSDIDTAPVGKLVQVVSGTQVKVAFTNTEDSVFLHTTSYSGRIMVAGLGGATPTVEVGEFLTPGTGTDNDGYWAVTASEANAWLVVVSVDNTNDRCEARLMF